MICGKDIAESVINITLLLKKKVLNITDMSTKKNVCEPFIKSFS